MFLVVSYFSLAVTTPTPSPGFEIVKVTRVIDGDTIYTYPPDVKHQAEILAAEAEAREADRGLWKVCPP